MIIYKATNLINHKIYIGKAKDFETRVKRHKKDYYSNKLKKVLYYAIKKYGWNSFKWEIVGECSVNEVNVAETETIWLYQSNNSIYGYNKTRGGDGRDVGYKHKEETIKKMKLSSKHTSPTEEHKQYLRELKLGGINPLILVDSNVIDLMYYLYTEEKWTFKAISKVLPYEWKLIRRRILYKNKNLEIRHITNSNSKNFTLSYKYF